MFDTLGSALAGMGGAGLSLVLLAAALGGVAHTIAGFGATFVIVPALALIAPSHLPGAVMVAMLPLTLLMTVVDRGELDWVSARRLLLARMPGIAIGVGIVMIADERLLTLVVGAVLLVAVIAASLGWQLAVTPMREWSAGMLSGVTGAATALGGPPLALLYRQRDPAVVRPTLAIVWLVGIVMSIAGLVGVGELTVVDATLGVTLSAALLAGLVVGRALIAHASPAMIRSAVLWWAALGGVAAVLRAWLG